MRKINTKETGKKIRKQMHMADVDSSELAKKLGYSDRSTINRWARGQSMPSYENLVNMAIVLNCKIRDIVGFR